MKVSSQLVGSGKLGNVVYTQNSGVCITRALAESVRNPNTQKQVNQRARLKLMSQLAADMANTIAIPRKKLVSARNGFISKNFDLSFASDGEAGITLENVQLTEGRSGLAQITATRNSSTGIDVALAENSASMHSRVVWIIYKKTSEQKLQMVASKVATDAGENGTFPKHFDYVSGEIIIYAYGMKDTNAKATAKYNDLYVQSGTDIAQLVATRSLSLTDYQFSETRGATMAAGANSITATAEGHARVYVTANGNGTVAGGGDYEIGSQVTVSATPASGSTFLGWKVQGQSNYISTSASYTFTLQSTADLIAYFNTPGGGGGDDEPDEN